MRIAVVDVGTNTALLLLGECVAEGEVVVLRSERRVVRLGEGTDSTGVISDSAIKRLIATLEEYRSIVGEVDSVRVVATSASRDAANIGAVIREVQKSNGWSYEVLSGEEEARLSHAGAVSALSSEQQAGHSIAVVDVGGGSTEITVCSPGQRIPEFRVSMQLGTVRLFERLVRNQPVLAEDIGAVEAVVRKSLIAANIPQAENLLLVGSAGTAKTLATLDRRRSIDTPHLDDPHFISDSSLQYWRSYLCSLTFEQTLALDPDLMNGRADVISVGAILVEEIVKHLEVRGILVSPFSLRHGVAAELCLPQ